MSVEESAGAGEPAPTPTVESSVPHPQKKGKPPGLPEILIEPGKLDQILDKAEQVLMKKGIGIYQRGGQLVTIVKAPATGKRALVQRRQESLVIKGVGKALIAEKLTKHGRWCRLNESTGKTKYVDCPDKYAIGLMERMEWKLSCLDSIITAPALRSDGSILETEGYDEETGVFFDPNGCQFCKIPNSPTLDDAKKALGILEDLIKNFPFEDEASRSVAIAAILTALERRFIPTAPLFGFTAPKMSSGKSLLADLVSIIATGRDNSVISQADTEAEEKKRYLAVLQEGDQVVCIDNVEKPLGSPALCSILTQSMYKDRILGETRNAAFPTSTLFLANGNNLTFVGDLSTRALMCRLDPKMERPEEREFEGEIRKDTLENRGRLVCAALTILRAYHCAGRPKQNVKQFGRFEVWSSWIRSSIIWLGRADPNESRRDIENADPERAALGNILEALHETFGTTPFTTRDIMAKIQNHNPSESEEELREAVLEFCSDIKGRDLTRTLGNRIARCKKRIERGRCFDQAGEHNRAVRWQIIVMEEKSPKRAVPEEQQDFFENGNGKQKIEKANEYACCKGRYLQSIPD